MFDSMVKEDNLFYENLSTQKQYKINVENRKLNQKHGKNQPVFLARII